MTHGCQWLHEIPVTHVYSSRDCHVNETNRAQRREDDGAQSISSFASVQRVPQQYERRTQQPARLGLMKTSRGISEPPQKLTLKTHSRPSENPMAILPEKLVQRAPFQNLKNWESTGSLASNSTPMYENMRAARSFSHPRVTQPAVSTHQVLVPFKGLEHKPKAAQSTIASIQENENQNGRQMKLIRTNTDPFNHPFFHSNGNEHLLSYPTQMASYTEIPRTDQAQESLMLQNAQTTNANRTLQPKRDNSVVYHAVHKPTAQSIYYGGVEKSQPTYDGATIAHAAQRNVPFTKMTGKEGQENFFRLMKPTTNRNMEKTDLGRVVSLPPRHSAPRQQEQLTRKKSPHHVIVDRPVDDSVIYTEISPQTLSRNGRASERKNTMIRSRSCSPVPFAEFKQPHNRVERLSNKPQSTRNQKQGNGECLTFGGEKPILNDFHSYRHTSAKNQPPQNFVDKEDNQSQTPSEYSISFGTPRLELRRMNKMDINNNQMKDRDHRRDSVDKTKPFPNSASLDQMLSDSSSSKKSGTIKSVLKQPSDKFPIGRDVRGPNRSPKRVTIKEHESRRAPQNGFLQSTYRAQPTNGLAPAPVRTTNNHRPPDHKFKVINRRIVMAS